MMNRCRLLHCNVLTSFSADLLFSEKLHRLFNGYSNLRSDTVGTKYIYVALSCFQCLDISVLIYTDVLSILNVEIAVHRGMALLQNGISGVNTLNRRLNLIGLSDLQGYCILLYTDALDVGVSDILRLQQVSGCRMNSDALLYDLFLSVLDLVSCNVVLICSALLQSGTFVHSRRSYGNICHLLECVNILIGIAVCFIDKVSIDIGQRCPCKCLLTASVGNDLRKQDSLNLLFRIW